MEQGRLRQEAQIGYVRKDECLVVARARIGVGGRRGVEGRVSFTVVK